jgi:hypothetical protein
VGLAVGEGENGGADVAALSAARALLAYFHRALLLAKTHNDATIIDALADHALNLVVGLPTGEESA